MKQIWPQTKQPHTDSYYAATAITAPPVKVLEGEVRADVCIIGGGYTGVSSALHLAEKGYKVVLLEANKLGWGASGRNGGHVGTGQRKEQEDLEQMLGMDTAKALWNLGLEAVETVESIIERHGIECDLKHGILHLASKAREADGFRAGVEHLQKVYGYDQARYLDKAAVDQEVGSDQYHAGYLDLGSRHLHPLNYLLGMANAAEKAGAVFYQDSPVLDYSQGQKVVVRTEKGQVSADHLIFATNGYLAGLEPGLAKKIMPINNFVLATEPLSPAQARKLITHDYALQDSLFVINYWKLSGDNRLIFGGGENYTSRFPTDMKGFVRKYMLRVYPELAGTGIDYAWGGTLAITLNRLPCFGKLGPNVYYAQGFSGHGVPTATMAGKLMAEAVSGTAERFDIMASLPKPGFPGGTLLRWPGLVAGMLFYSLLDKL
ncbi:NAD(P)/FAD-dependent oxidoreductase [Simiduia agarivorans]|uniref:FAD dependent oxidoreductase n=1 Tax=Simiduia agarivorans (strain DSM 21679 / JCM 13881 / BCRC 17597 / SA1) TaxID=1117647 RepID=K4KI37_SIMAS|nr:FAD-binding oxidoreductase [Simiduia agarivorans]AFU97865.2 FAD dependent oxidoreductase [Simiduia agarivorans SA1 = DSM 21679]